jgi:hypothetical protein
MKTRTTARLVTAVSGLGVATGAAVFAVSASAGAMSLTAATLTSAQPQAVPATVCGDGPWIGPNGVDVNGQPNFDPGDAGAAYIWHDNGGWHLRTTDVQSVAHHYTGTITVSPDATVTFLNTVKQDPDDHVWITNDKVIHYDLTTYAGVDGIDFGVSSCAGSKAHEALEFALDYNGREQDIARIKLGPGKAHPLFATFDVYRTV